MLINKLISFYIYSFIIYLSHGTNLNINGPVFVRAGCNGCGSSGSGSDSKNEPAYSKSNDGTNNDGSKTSNKTGVDLKILERRTTSDHNYQSNDNVETFTPKGNKAFKKVKANANEIWSTEKKEEYATKVEVSGTNNDRVVTIYTGDNKTKKFKKDNNGKWNEEGQEDQKTGDGKTGTTGTGGGNQTSTGGGTGKTGTGTTPGGGTTGTN